MNGNEIVSNKEWIARLCMLLICKSDDIMKLSFVKEYINSDNNNINNENHGSVTTLRHCTRKQKQRMTPKTVVRNRMRNNERNENGHR